MHAGTENLREHNGGYLDHHNHDHDYSNEIGYYNTFLVSRLWAFYNYAESL